MQSTECYEECVETFNQVNNYHNDDLKTHVLNNLGKSYLRSKNLEKSEGSFSKVIDLLQEKRTKLKENI